MEGGTTAAPRQYPGRAGATACLALSLAIFVMQLAMSRWWLARFNYGPMEWLWRWWTYGAQPMLRKAPT